MKQAIVKISPFRVVCACKIVHHALTCYPALICTTHLLLARSLQACVIEISKVHDSLSNNVVQVAQAKTAYSDLIH